MSRRSKGPRLWLRPTRRDSAGRITHESTWLVLDGARQIGTGCSASDLAGAEKALGKHLGSKHTKTATATTRDPAAILVDDVLALYARDVAPNHADPKKTDSRIGFLDAFWSGKTLDKVTGPECRAYARQRGSDAAARRELEDLRSAINHHRKEGLHDRIVSVVLPDKSLPRERWMTKGEAARLILGAWRDREVRDGVVTNKRPRRHVARFMVVARYMGSRASVIASASIEPKRPKDRAWIDLTNGVFYGRPTGERETTKRKQTVRVPPELLAHLRRWRANGQRFVVERAGKPVAKVKRAHQEAVFAAGLDGVTQHTWRHSLATWMMQAGADPWKAADYLAMDVKVLISTYGHHHPDHSAEVHSAFRAHRQRTAKDKSEQRTISTDQRVPETPVNIDI